MLIGTEDYERIIFIDGDFILVRNIAQSIWDYLNIERIEVNQKDLIKAVK